MPSINLKVIQIKYQINEIFAKEVLTFADRIYSISDYLKDIFQLKRTGKSVINAWPPTKDVKNLLRESKVVFVEQKIVKALQSNQPLCITDFNYLVESGPNLVVTAINNLEDIGYIKMLQSRSGVKYYVIYNWDQV